MLLFSRGNEFCFAYLNFSGVLRKTLTKRPSGKIFVFPLRTLFLVIFNEGSLTAVVKSKLKINDEKKILTECDFEES